MQKHPIFIYKALSLRCLLVQIYTAGYCYSMGATQAATCIHCPYVTLSTTHALERMSVISPGKGIIKIRTNKDSTKVRSKSISQHLIPRTRCFKTVFMPKQTWLPGRQCWCHRMFATLWITGSFCLWSQCQNVSGSSLPDDWDNSLQYPAPASLTPFLLYKTAVSHMFRCYSNQWLTCGSKTKQISM